MVLYQYNFNQFLKYILEMGKIGLILKMLHQKCKDFIAAHLKGS